MKAIDRLIIKAKRRCGIDLKLYSGIIYRDEKQPGKWVAMGYLWNGVQYNKPDNKAEYATCVCDSIEEAEAALYELGEKYPNNKVAPIIIEDDLME